MSIRPADNGKGAVAALVGFSAFALLLATGCSTATTVYRKDGTAVSGQLAAADAGAGDTAGGPGGSSPPDAVVIPRREIDRVERPGKPALRAGVPILAVGLTGMAVSGGYLHALSTDLCGGGDGCSRQRRHAAIGLGVAAMPTAIGAGLVGWGVRAHRRSGEVVDGRAPLLLRDARPPEPSLLGPRLVLAGSGLLSAAGAVLMWRGAEERADVKRARRLRTWNGRVERMRTLYGTGGALIGLGGVGAALGSWWRSSRTSRITDDASVGVASMRGGAALVLSGRF